jgi:hypothetical protein
MVHCTMAIADTVEELQAELKTRTRGERTPRRDNTETLLDRLSEMKSKIGHKLKEDAVRIQLSPRHDPSYPIRLLCPLLTHLIQSTDDFL